KLPQPFTKISLSAGAQRGSSGREILLFGLVFLAAQTSPRRIQKEHFLADLAVIPGTGPMLNLEPRTRRHSHSCSGHSKKTRKLQRTNSSRATTRQSTEFWQRQGRQD